MELKFFFGRGSNRLTVVANSIAPVVIGQLSIFVVVENAEQPLSLHRVVKWIGLHIVRDAEKYQIANDIPKVRLKERARAGGTEGWEVFIFSRLIGNSLELQTFSCPQSKLPDYLIGVQVQAHLFHCLVKLVKGQVDLLVVGFAERLVAQLNIGL